jgi:hypothetical protein
MNGRVILRILLAVVLFLLTLSAYNAIDDLEVWRDSEEDYFDLEETSSEESGKQLFVRIISWLPFIGLLFLTIMALNSARIELNRNKVK